MHEYAADPGRSVDRRRFAAGSAALPRRMHPTFSFETSNAPDWYGDVRLCRTGLNPHFLFVLPKRLPGFPAELYRFGTEKPGGYSLLKRECPPRPPKEKRGGISISPRTPLKRHKGAGCGPPLWKPLPELDGGAAAEREAEGVLFAPRCAPCPQMRRRTDLRFRYSAAGRGVSSSVGSS